MGLIQREDGKFYDVAEDTKKYGVPGVVATLKKIKPREAKKPQMTPEEQREFDEEFELLAMAEKGSEEKKKTGLRVIVPTKTDMEGEVKKEAQEPKKTKTKQIHTVGTLRADLRLHINKNISKEEMNTIINDPELLEKHIEDGTIHTAEFLGKEYDLTREEDREKIEKILLTRPAGVKYLVKNIENK